MVRQGVGRELSPRERYEMGERLKEKRLDGGVFLLSHQDSNLGKQNQNLMCYHYTMGQSMFDERVCKSTTNLSIWQKLF